MAMQQHPFNTHFVFTPAQGPFRRVTEDQARQFNDDGVFVLEDALDREALDALLAVIDPIEAHEEQVLRDQYGGRHLISRADEITFTLQLALRVEAVRALVCGPVFQDLCHDLIGPDVRLYWDMAVYKKPGTVAPFPWHQDNGYTFVDPQQYLTCWVALTDATVENGCLWVLPGTHKRGTFVHRATRIGLVCIEEEPEGRVAVPIRAGSIAVMSSLLPHATGPNLSTGVRKGLIAEFIPDGAVTISRPDAGEVVRRPLVAAQNMWVLQAGASPAANAAGG